MTSERKWGSAVASRRASSALLIGVPIALSSSSEAAPMRGLPSAACTKTRRSLGQRLPPPALSQPGISASRSQVVAVAQAVHGDQHRAVRLLEDVAELLLPQCKVHEHRHGAG